MGMLDKLKQLVEEAQKRGARAVDASQFNHPVAAQTEWHPLKPGGANFQTHRLDDSNPDLLVFKATTFKSFNYKAINACFNSLQCCRK